MDKGSFMGRASMGRAVAMFSAMCNAPCMPILMLRQGGNAEKLSSQEMAER